MPTSKDYLHHYLLDHSLTENCSEKHLQITTQRKDFSVFYSTSHDHSQEKVSVDDFNFSVQANARGWQENSCVPKKRKELNLSSTNCDFLWQLFQLVKTNSPEAWWGKWCKFFGETQSYYMSSRKRRTMPLVHEKWLKTSSGEIDNYRYPNWTKVINETPFEGQRRWGHLQFSDANYWIPLQKRQKTKKAAASKKFCQHLIDSMRTLSVPKIFSLNNTGKNTLNCSITRYAIADQKLKMEKSSDSSDANFRA